MFTQIYAKLPAQDVERARAFYAEKLGLEPYGELHGHMYYTVGGAHFMVFPSSGAPSGTHDQLGFVVDDLAAAVEELATRGVALEEGGVQDLGVIKVAWIKDSEGNLLSIAEFPQGSPFR